MERGCHTLKNTLKFGSVTGKAGICAERDFRAQVLVCNMAEDLIREAERKVARNAREKGYKYETGINENIAVGYSGNNLSA
jgi:hypothetical protein